MSKYKFTVGAQYKRSEIKASIGLDRNSKGGPWDTGYAERNGADFVFCNVGAAARTGHDYDNYFDGRDLIWRGKTNSHADQPTIRRMASLGAEVHIFWRADDRDPFTYAGLGKAAKVSDETPVRVRWRFGEPRQQSGVSRSAERLPTKIFGPIDADHVFNAVHMLLEGHTYDPFGQSTDYDLIADDDRPPAS